MRSFVLIAIVGITALSVPKMALCRGIKDLTAEQKAQLAWTTAPWLDHDAKYKTINATVEQELASSKDVFKTVDNYEDKAARRPADSTLVYKWVYAAWQIRDGAKSASARTMLLQSAKNAINSAKYDSTFEVARLRFLLNGYSAVNSTFAPIAERLIAKAPDDFDIIKVYIDTYNEDDISLDMRMKLLDKAKKLVQMRPDDLAYGSLTEVYMELWHRTHKLEYGNDDIAAYHKCLDVAKKDYWFRPDALNMISHLQAEVANG